MSEAAAVYLRMKELFTGTPSRSRRTNRGADDPSASKPFGAGRDPRGLGANPRVAAGNDHRPQPH